MAGLSFEECDSELAAMPDPDQIRLRLTPEYLRLTLLTPEVASAVAAGMSVKQISEATSIPEQSVRRYLRMAEMKDLIAAEARRVIRHMGKRELKNEKYLALATSLAIMVDKGELLNGRPTERSDAHTNPTTVIERLNVAFFGSQGNAEVPSGNLIVAGEDPDRS